MYVLGPYRTKFVLSFKHGGRVAIPPENGAEIANAAIKRALTSRGGRWGLQTREPAVVLEAFAIKPGLQVSFSFL